MIFKNIARGDIFRTKVRITRYNMRIIIGLNIQWKCIFCIKSFFPPYDLVLISNISSCIPPIHSTTRGLNSFVNGNRSLTRSQFYKIKRANEIAYRHNGFFLVSFIQGHAWIETNRRKAITSDFNSTSCCHFNSFKYMYIFFHQ